ncbi:acetate/propionate family kinase [Nocardiopsis lambiniae]|uniref:Acetate kinase n=1 Tax=Nocardiopsis lambiniae TaxID=3075539 RepID=A0ABU2MHB8_9ACTN|nr:acetate/propionate family kinase [Nocardiopsis sp. DSM 44743]MDT0331959.1 acetate/propionate family kinase [Nocardiopsis sp. DSM 44743]
MRVLVVNAGSSTLKSSMVDGDDTVLGSETIELVGGAWDPVAVRGFLDRFPSPDVVGHRVVHGGREFVSPVRLDPTVVGRLEELTPLAPLHQPKALSGIAAITEALPGVPQVACFDTAFHASLPAEAFTYAVPVEWRERFGVRRYGFHGLSHAYVSGVAAERTGGRRIVTAHLGAGASLAAVLEGRCVDTTMGFTPLEGLVMATRSGSVDPGMVLWLQRQGGLDADEVAEGLERGGGLTGLAGTADMREVLAGVERGEARSVLAFGVYVHRLRASVAAMAAALGGLDVLVFTAGVGERSAPVRWAVAEGLGFLGVAVDRAANEGVDGEADISGAGASVRTLVIPAREDVQIARGAREVVGG